MKILNFDSAIATVSAGTAAAPSISFANDPNTGIYSPGADQVAISTGGTGRLFIRADGGVAVNTAVSPLDAQMQFAVGGPIGLFPYTQNVVGTSNVTFRSGLGSAGAEDFIKHEITNFNNGANYGTALSFLTRTSTAALERLRITSAGNVGIGTASPAQNLETRGTVRISADDFGRVDIIPTGGNGNAAVIQQSTTNPRNGGDLALQVDSQFGVGGNLLFRTGGSTERARIDSSGRLLVGTATSADVGGASAVAQFTSTGTAPHTLSLVRANEPILAMGRTGALINGSGLGVILFCGDDGTDLNSIGASITAQVDGTHGVNDMPGRLVFSTTADGAASPTERMRISNSGQVSINTTIDPATAFFDGRLRVDSSTTVTSFKTSGGAGVILQSLWHEATTGDNQFVSFGTETTRVTRGSITYNRTGGVVAYNTTSDYRAKTILGDIQNPGDTIDALKVYRGVMNGATVERPMLIAHEAQEVAPYCVTGEKDAVDADGNPIYQQMDHQVLVPLLIAEIQQLRARVAALESA